MKSLHRRALKPLRLVSTMVLTCLLGIQAPLSSEAKAPNPADDPRPGARVPQAPQTPTPSPLPQSQSKLSKAKSALTSIVRTVLCQKDLRNQAVLNKRGPQFQGSFNPSNFSIEGFVMGDWPGIIEYQSTGPALLTVEIEKTKAHFQQVLEASQTQPGTGQARQVIFKLPPEFGDRPRLGRISIKALVTNSQFDMSAVGAGGAAVGSVTIDQLRFQTRGTQRYDYQFHALRDFEKWAADFMLVSRTVRGELVTTRVQNNTFLDRVDRGAYKDGRWDGKDSHGRISIGPHKVLVRVWRTVSGRRGGDWVASVSRQQVQVR